MMSRMPHWRYVISVSWRQYIVWRKLIWSTLTTNIANPILFLFAFGFGLGQFIDRMDGMSYMAFVVPGMIAYSAMFTASFETTIGSYSRYEWLQNWDAVLASPVTLTELMMGEVLWASVKAMLSAVCVLVVGWMWGGIPSLSGALIGLPLVFVASICFACCGLTATAFFKGWDYVGYFFTFWVTPMFVFCGVFFEAARYPVFIQKIALLLPMTHLVAVIRPLSAGVAIDAGTIALHMSYLIVLSIVAFTVALKRMHKKMFD